MIQITLKTYAAPGNIDVIPNVSVIGGQTLSANASGSSNASQVADQAAAVTGIGSAPFVAITYTDANGAIQHRTLSASDIKDII